MNCSYKKQYFAYSNPSSMVYITYAPGLSLHGFNNWLNGFNNDMATKL